LFWIFFGIKKVFFSFFQVFFQKEKEKKDPYIAGAFMLFCVSNIQMGLC
jgi:hypothetical protein